jgi:uncharacterized protein (DUF2147 family)
MISTTLKSAAAALPMLFALGATSAFAGPVGTWIDHTGRGAVEITDCNGALCGRIVWLKDANNNQACGVQVIGNARPVAGGKWDGGWIFDPDNRSKYDVELTMLGEQKLKVLGYAGMKMMGQTMTWTRAPADLKRCDQPSAAAPATPAPRPQADARQADPTPPVAEAAPAAPEREANVAKPERRAGRAKECGIKISGLGEFSFPCPN